VSLVVAVVVSVAAVDSLNPSTVLPALLYGLGRNAVRNVALFTAGVFGVSTVGGLALVFGPGRALLSIVSHPSKHVVHLIEAGVGVLLIAVAAYLWVKRANIRQRLSQQRASKGGSAFFVGAAIMAAELPTALPYFGALIAITEGVHSAVTSFALVLVYNVIFVAPLLVLLGVLVVSGERGAEVAARLRQHIIRYAPVLLPVLLAVLGAGLIVAALR
jgi:cytochrome c biogenesis protein CcdA